MAEINGMSDALAKYFMQNNIEVNSENIEKYSNDLAELAEDFKHVGSYEVSIFKPDENTEIDRDTFLEYIKCATGENGFDEETANLYFDLLNANGGDTLDYDELTKIMNKNGEVSDFSMWQNLAFSISSTGVISSAANYTVISSSNSKDVAENIKDVYGEDSDEYKAALAGQDVTISKQTLKSDKIDEIVTKIINGEAKLEDYEDLLTVDSYKALKEAYEKAVNKGNEEDSTAKTNGTESTTNAGETNNEGAVESTTNAGETNNEGAVESTTNVGKTEENEEVVAENVAPTPGQYSNLSEAEAKEIATQLYNATAGRWWGTDEDTVDNILNSLSGDDLVYVMTVYMDKYGGSFVQDVDDDYSGKKQEQVFNVITTKLVEAAENGNDAAVSLIAKELHKATGDRNGTAEDFVEGILGDGKASDALIKKIVDRYFAINDVTLSEDIDGDFSGVFEGKAKTKYLKRISSAISNASANT